MLSFWKLYGVQRILRITQTYYNVNGFLFPSSYFNCLLEVLQSTDNSKEYNRNVWINLFIYSFLNCSRYLLLPFHCFNTFWNFYGVERTEKTHNWYNVNGCYRNITWKIWRKEIRNISNPKSKAVELLNGATVRFMNKMWNFMWRLSKMFIFD